MNRLLFRSHFGSRLIIGIKCADVLANTGFVPFVSTDLRHQITMPALEDASSAPTRSVEPAPTPLKRGRTMLALESGPLASLEDMQLVKPSPVAQPRLDDTIPQPEEEPSPTKLKKIKRKKLSMEGAEAIPELPAPEVTLAIDGPKEEGVPMKAMKVLRSGGGASVKELEHANT